MYPETGEMACRFLERTFRNHSPKQFLLVLERFRLCKAVSEIVGANEINAKHILSCLGTLHRSTARIYW